jgi:hypothetical protein
MMRMIMPSGTPTPAPILVALLEEEPGVEGEEVDVLVLEDFNVVELNVVFILVMVLVLREVHRIAVFPAIEARVES